MRNVIKGAFMELISNIPDLKTKDALDIFAREGTWNSHTLYKSVNSLECWEIDSNFVKNLKLNLPKASCFCRDSIKYINNNICNSKYDIVFIDNSLSTYGDNNQYCEHFDFIKNAENLVKKNGYIIFNVSLSPFNENPDSIYSKRRNEFYNTSRSSDLTLDFMKSYYKKLFRLKSKNQITHLLREKYHSKEYLYFFLIKF